MTSDLRERLRDLSSEMPALHAPPNLQGRVKRRQMGSIVVAAAAVVVLVAVVRVGVEAVNLFQTTPGSSTPTLYPWAVEPTSPLEAPEGIAVMSSGEVLISEYDLGLLRHVDADGTLTTVAGGGTVSPLDVGPGGVPASSLDLGRTGYVLRASDGTTYVTDMQLNIVVSIDPNGTATVLAGTGEAGYSGDGGPATRAKLDFPSGLAMAPDGTLYVADNANNAIRAIGTDGRIRTVVGTGELGDAGDGGPAVDAQLMAPAGIAVDAAGNLYIADQNNDRVRRVNTSGVIETVAGQ